MEKMVSFSFKGTQHQSPEKRLPPTPPPKGCSCLFLSVSGERQGAKGTSRGLVCPGEPMQSCVYGGL